MKEGAFLGVRAEPATKAALLPTAQTKAKTRSREIGNCICGGDTLSSKNTARRRDVGGGQEDDTVTAYYQESRRRIHTANKSALDV